MKTKAFCRICGHEPDTPTNTLMRFWDPDDGWRFGALCPYCKDDYGNVQPHPDDYAYDDPYSGDIETDEDITDLL